MHDFIYRNGTGWESCDSVYCKVHSANLRSMLSFSHFFTWMGNLFCFNLFHCKHCNLGPLYLIKFLLWVVTHIHLLCLSSSNNDFSWCVHSLSVHLFQNIGFTWWHLIIISKTLFPQTPLLPKYASLVSTLCKNLRVTYDPCNLLRYILVMSFRPLQFTYLMTS